jgi:hypothetical protein
MRGNLKGREFLASDFARHQVCRELAMANHCLTPPRSFFKQPQQQRQENADQQTRDQWKMKREVAALIMNISWQPPQPAPAEPGPKQGADYNQDQPD